MNGQIPCVRERIGKSVVLAEDQAYTECGKGAFGQIQSCSPASSLRCVTSLGRGVRTLLDYEAVTQTGVQLFQMSARDKQSFFPFPLLSL